MTLFVLGTDRAEVRERAARVADWVGAADADAVVARHDHDWIVGTPDEAIARLWAYEEAGVARVFLQNLLADDVAMLELAAREVLPAFR